MIADKARRLTDKRLEELEKQIENVYKEAQADITKKWDKYMANASSRLQELQSKYDEAVKSGDKDAITNAGKNLQQAKIRATITDKKYKEMVDDTAKRIAEANKIALSYANGALPQVYSVNYNQVLGQAEKFGIDFSIVDESTVKNLMTQGEIQLPKKKLFIPKDQQWNKKQLNSSVLQGIIQGESMKDIAQRIKPVVGNNSNAAIRNARTMVTGAENKGRLDSYHNLEDRGAIIKKVWMATKDDRTREWHLDMDGQEVDVDEPFIDGNGNELDYPGDPSAAPETVYNCRCSMRTHIIGVKNKEDEDEEDAEKHEIVNGEDISDTWERRPDEFDFEIEDVINAQGFDGLPNVVNEEEFDEAVKVANDGKGFIAQRAYSAPDQETLDAYRDQLYNGKWYVDCSGGSRLGYGMYCSSNDEGKLVDGIKNMMKEYSNGKTAYIETFTLDKSAKIINYHDAYEQKQKWLDTLPVQEMRKYRKMDVGSFAAMKGYDAIIEDASGGSATTVILNRTKVIFKGK